MERMTPIRLSPGKSQRSTVAFWIVTAAVLAALFAGNRDLRSFDDVRSSAAAVSTASAQAGVDTLPIATVREAHSLDTVAVGSQTTIIVAGAPPIAVARGTTLAIAGWAVDLGARLPSAEAFATVDGATFPAVVGGSREDVAKALGSAAYAPSAFRIDIDTSKLRTGRATVAFYGVDAARRARYDFHSNLAIDITN